MTALGQEQQTTDCVVTLSHAAACKSVLANAT